MIVKLFSKPNVAVLFEKVNVTLSMNKEYINEAEEFSEMVEGGYYEIKIKHVEEDRTLSQNSYAWKLMSRIARHEHLSQTEVYRKYVRDFYMYTICRVKNEAAGKVAKGWRRNGLGWQTEISNQDDEFTELVMYYGMSSWSKQEMSDFIEMLRHECYERHLATDI